MSLFAKYVYLLSTCPSLYGKMTLPFLGNPVAPVYVSASGKMYESALRVSLT